MSLFFLSFSPLLSPLLSSSPYIPLKRAASEGGCEGGATEPVYPGVSIKRFDLRIHVCHVCYRLHFGNRFLALLHSEEAPPSAAVWRCMSKRWV